MGIVLRHHQLRRIAFDVEEVARFALLWAAQGDQPPTDEFMQPEIVEDLLPVRGISIGD